MRSGPNAEIPLKRTWYEIAEYLMRDPRALNILHVVNAVAPRSWGFRFGFDHANRTILEIWAEPRLTDAEILAIVDGSIPEVLFSEEMRLCLESELLVARPAAFIESPPATNLIEAEAMAGAGQTAQLVLYGFFGRRLPARIQDLVAVRSELGERTWFGSSKFARHRHELKWQMLGQTRVFAPFDRFTSWLRAAPVFRRSFSVKGNLGQHLGEVTLGTSPLVERNRSYHTRLGRFEAADISPNFWNFAGETEDYWIVEIDEQQLRSGLAGELVPVHLARDLLGAISAEASRALGAEDYRTYLSERRRRKVEQAADALAARQTRARRFRRVSFHGQDLLCVPTSENEVVALLCKLEGMGGLPFRRFKLVEYTPSRGIDALADFQIEPGDVPVVLGAVEFEYYFENFFDHGHPVEQVSLVICWDFRDDSATARNISKVKDYLYVYREDGYSLWILILARIPGLEFEEED